MKKVKLSIAIVSLSLMAFQPAAAGTTGESAFSIGSLVNLVVLLCALICFLWGIKILGLVKGGLLSKGWQMFVLGFGFLVLAQIIILVGKFHLAGIPEAVPSLLYLLMAGTWLAGLNQTRKVLE